MKYKALSLLMVILWQGVVFDNADAPACTGEEFRILQPDSRSMELVVEEHLTNMDTEGVETQYWYPIASGQEQVYKAALLDIMGEFHRGRK